jgi:chorismate dehydratase
VPGVSLASRGAVASVALYTSKPVEEVRSIAIDTGSRTSVALLAILCARLFRIAPKTEPHAPSVEGMLASSDAALIIGDNALFLDHQARGLGKIDLGEAWRELTGLPFVYAVWAGHSGVLAAPHVDCLQRARDAGVAHARDIADACYPNDSGRRDIAERYLRDNMKYDLDEQSQAGLKLFYQYAAELGLVSGPGELRFYP